MSKVSRKIVEVLNKTPNKKAGEIVKATGLAPQQVYHSLTYMKRKKVLRQVNGKYSILLDILPATTMPGPVQEEKVVVNKYVRGPSEREFRELKGKFDRLEYEHEELKNKYTQMAVAHLDAKAVIAYLESKLAASK